MKFIHLKNTAFLCALLSVFAVNSQRNLTLYNMQTLPQAMSVNPAFSPKANVFINIPLGMQSIGFTTNGFNVSELLVKNAQDSLVINNSEDFFNGMHANANNFIGLRMRNELFGFGFRVKKNYFTFNVVNNFSYELGFTSDFMRFLLAGNGGALLGRRADFDGTGIYAKDYMSYALGYNREVDDKLTVGGRIKFLSGIADVTTDKTTFGLTTGVGATSLAVDGAAVIKSSNAFAFIPSKKDSLDTTSFDPMSLMNNAYNFSNFGMAFDLGATYKINDKISVNASIIDLGWITWKTNNKNYNLKAFNYTFDGLDVSKSITDTSVNAFETLQDTLGEIFKTEETTESYSTGLATRFYIGGNYKANDYFSFGALWFNRFIRNEYRSGLVLSTTATIKNWLSASLNYGVFGGAYNNLGFGLSIKPGPFQIYFMTDNIMALPMFNPGGSQNASVSMGMSILIGNKDKVKKPKEISPEKPVSTDTKEEKIEEPKTPRGEDVPAPSEK